MTCCDIITQTFVNESSTTVPYTGNRPTVTVSYLIDGVWQAFVAAQVQLTDTNVIIDHGGVGTGVIKLVQ